MSVIVYKIPPNFAWPAPKPSASQTLHDKGAFAAVDSIINTKSNERAPEKGRNQVLALKQWAAANKQLSTLPLTVQQQYASLFSGADPKKKKKKKTKDWIRYG